MNLENYLSNRNIVLIGAGQLGQMALNLWPESLNKPILFLDTHRQENIDGIPIERVDEHQFSTNNVYLLSYFKDSATNIIELFNNKVKQKILTVYDLLTYYLPDQFSNGWCGAEDNFISTQLGLEYLHNEYSRQVYLAVINWRYKRILDPKYPITAEIDKYNINKYDIHNHYFDLVIDGGSYDLSFPKTLHNAGHKWRKLIVIEPDEQRMFIIKKLLLTNEECKSLNNNIILDERALWSHNEGCMFYSNGQLSARIAQNPDQHCIKVNSNTLSNLFEEHSINHDLNNLVKLHVEGAEWPIIQNLLTQYKNFKGLNFLINLSHDENSLLKIINTLGITNHFEIYLDSHSLFGEGLTLFAKNINFNI
jgi:FkbM family methyltransferase